MRAATVGRADLALVAASFLFGSTFLVVQDAVEDVDPFAFLAVRFLVAAAVLWPLARRQRETNRGGERKAGAACGVALLAGYAFQTVGLQYTTSTVSAFITYLLVVIVPVLAVVVLRRAPTLPTIAGVVLATAGLFFLNGADVDLARGEVLTVGCAVAFAVHVVLLAVAAPRFNALRLNSIQLAVVGVACLVPGAVGGSYRFPLGAWAAAIYTGIAASAIALSLQVWAQRRMGPTRTALLLTLEPVFAALLGYVDGERLGWTGLFGAVLILGGVVVAEVAPRPPVTTRR